MYPQLVKINNEPRITVEFGDATDEKFVKKILDKYGSFDVVLDDGSHKSVDMRLALQLFWKHTNMVYCIEDLGTQYEKNYFEMTGREFGLQFIPDKIPFTKDLFGLVDSINKHPDANKEIFKICFYKWQVYLWRKV